MQVLRGREEFPELPARPFGQTREEFGTSRDELQDKIARAIVAMLLTINPQEREYYTGSAKLRPVFHDGRVNI